MLKSLEQYLRKHCLVRPGERIGVAVSGGADSVALLRAFAELAPERGVIPFVLHLNHSLRGPESDADEAFVRELSAQLSLECAIETADIASLAAILHLSLEAAGRRARYAFFLRAAAEHRLDCVATAHTRDDQAETVLLRLLRGTGTSGLAGIHRNFDLSELASSAEPEPETELVSSPSVPRLIRPLLSTTRQQVEEFLSDLHQSFRQDSSNASPEFLRNRVRAQLLPELERDYNPRVRQALCETAEIASAENAFLDALATAALSEQQNPELGVELKLLKTQPLALQRRILRRLCLPHGLALDFAQLENLRDFALAGRAGRFKLPRGFAAEVVRSKLFPARISLLPPEQLSATAIPYCVQLPIPGSISFDFGNRTDTHISATLLDGTTALREYNRDVLLSAERVGACLTIRNLLPGDRFQPLHCSTERKVNRLLQEQFISSSLRRSWPVALVGDSIVWVPGLPVAEQAAWSAGNGAAIVVLMHS